MGELNEAPVRPIAFDRGGSTSARTGILVLVAGTLVFWLAVLWLLLR